MRSPKKIQQSGRSAELLTGAGEQDVDPEDLAEFMGRIRTSWSVGIVWIRNYREIAKPLPYMLSELRSRLPG